MSASTLGSVGTLLGLAGFADHPLPTEMSSGKLFALYARPSASFLEGEIVFSVGTRFRPLELPVHFFLCGLLFFLPGRGLVVHMFHDREHHTQQAFHQGILLIHRCVQVGWHYVEVDSQRCQLVSFLVAVPVFSGYGTCPDVHFLLMRGHPFDPETPRGVLFKGLDGSSM